MARAVVVETGRRRIWSWKRVHDLIEPDLLLRRRAMVLVVVERTEGRLLIDRQHLRWRRQGSRLFRDGKRMHRSTSALRSMIHFGLLMPCIGYSNTTRRYRSRRRWDPAVPRGGVRLESSVHPVQPANSRRRGRPHLEESVDWVD
jgi:hypothetical protein